MNRSNPKGRQMPGCLKNTCGYYRKTYWTFESIQEAFYSKQEVYVTMALKLTKTTQKGPNFSRGYFNLWAQIQLTRMILYSVQNYLYLMCRFVFLYLAYRLSNSTFHVQTSGYPAKKNIPKACQPNNR